MSVFWIYGEKFCEKGRKTKINDYQFFAGSFYAFVKMFGLSPQICITLSNCNMQKVTHIAFSGP